MGGEGPLALPRKEPYIHFFSPRARKKRVRLSQTCSTASRYLLTSVDNIILIELVRFKSNYKIDILCGKNRIFLSDLNFMKKK